MGLWASWSPEDWGQGKKMQPRGEKSCYIAPDDYLAWHKIQVEKKVGRELEDRGYVPKWTEILARDFALSYRDQNGKRPVDMDFTRGCQICREQKHSG